MQTTLRPYDPNTDYARIREFLIDTFTLYQKPFNWLIDRWNFCRYCVIPIHNYYNVRYFGVPTRPLHHVRDELPYWEKTIGVWENEEGAIVGVVHSENEEAGEAWTQIHPDYIALYDEMVTYAEAHLADRVDDVAFVKLYVNDGSELEAIARARGYKKLPYTTHHAEYVIDPEALPEPELPDGFVIKSVLDEDDVDKRRIAKAIAFGGGYAPSDWVPASLYQQIQQAPDYRKDLDLFIVAPNGEYVSFCTIWVDEKNRYANFEPVGTHAAYQRQGLGRALLTEGFRRMAARGITRSFMDSGNEFYRKIGFKELPEAYTPWIKYFPA
jgi:ribosomal protein S18 acetylase RimI-like enzyme